MYSIYTNIYGIHIGEELNRKVQESELSEVFDSLELPDGFSCDVPYSGDDFADIHLGVVLSSTDSGRECITTATKEQKNIWKKGIKAVKEQVAELVQQWKDEYPDNDYTDIDAVIGDFLEALDGEPSVYQAYSTS